MSKKKVLKIAVASVGVIGAVAGVIAIKKHKCCKKEKITVD
jgi:hypothetical protein